jgi:hypothetical protein
MPFYALSGEIAVRCFNRTSPARGVDCDVDLRCVAPNASVFNMLSRSMLSALLKFLDQCSNDTLTSRLRPTEFPSRSRSMLMRKYRAIRVSRVRFAPISPLRLFAKNEDASRVERTLSLSKMFK